MAKFFRSKNDIGWLEITWRELAKYSGNRSPICDECLKELAGTNNVVLVPLLNQAYCPECGKAVVSRMHNYPVERPIAARREKFWLKYFGIKEVQ